MARTGKETGGQGNFMKKKLLVGCIVLLLTGMGAAGLYYYLHSREEEAGAPPMPSGLQGMEDVVAAAGTTSTGLIEKELEFAFLDTDLIVEEVYVSSSDQAEKGTKVLKITDSSLREATRELERAQMDASLAYRQGMIDYELGKLDAENTLKKSQIETGFAQTVYDDAIAMAEVEVEKAQQALLDAQELVDEYTDAIDNDFYYDDYEVEEKKAAYEKNVALFFQKLDDYGYELDDDDDDDPNTFNIVKKGEGGGGDAGASSGQNNDGESTVLQLLKSEYQENKEEYDQAVKDYEAATEKARAGIAAATDDLQLKQLALQEAQIELEKTKTSAQADYDTAVIKGQKAQAAYETELKSLEEALEICRDDEEEAAENYELFQETIGDGYIYTESAGTILMVRASKNSALSKDGMLMAYSDEDTIQVTAYVDQADIAKIEIGQVAAVVLEDYDTYTGVVAQINPISESSSRASVSYSVLLDLEGDISQLTANLTANVYFGLTGAEYDRLSGQQESSDGTRQPSGGTAPQGEAGQQPGGKTAPQRGAEQRSDGQAQSESGQGGGGEE